MNRFVIGALVQSDPVVTVIRRELRRLAPGTKVSVDEIRALLPDVLKRDVVEGSDADAAQARVGKAAGKKLRKGRRKKRAAPSVSDSETESQPEQRSAQAEKDRREWPMG